MAVETLVVQCPRCVVCGESSKAEVPQDGFLTWSQGSYVEDAFPTLTANERELLITGTHGECWEVLTAVDDTEWC